MIIIENHVIIWRASGMLHTHNDCFSITFFFDRRRWAVSYLDLKGSDEIGASLIEKMLNAFLISSTF